MILPGKEVRTEAVQGKPEFKLLGQFKFLFDSFIRQTKNLISVKEEN
jgi:hypothetical protein